jgi:hypothetical protein
VNFDKTYSCFVFFIKLSNMSWENCLLERKTIWRHECKTKCLNQTLPTSLKGMWFSIIKRSRSYKKSFCCTSFFWKNLS